MLFSNKKKYINPLFYDQTLKILKIATINLKRIQQEHSTSSYFDNSGPDIAFSRFAVQKTNEFCGSSLYQIANEIDKLGPIIQKSRGRKKLRLTSVCIPNKETRLKNLVIRRQALWLSHQETGAFVQCSKLVVICRYSLSVD